MPARSSYVWDRERREWVEQGETQDKFQRLAVNRTIEPFMSRSLPKWYPHAPRHVKSGRHRGACLFHGREEAKECARKAQDAGEGTVVYDD